MERWRSGLVEVSILGHKSLYKRHNILWHLDVVYSDGGLLTQENWTSCHTHFKDLSKAQLHPPLPACLLCPSDLQVAFLFLDFYNLLRSPLPGPQISYLEAPDGLSTVSS